MSTVSGSVRMREAEAMPASNPARVHRARLGTYLGARTRVASYLGLAIVAAALATALPGDAIVRAIAAAAQPPTRTAATISAPQLKEISGCAVSSQTPGGGRIVWVHNDSGDGPNVYAIDGRTGWLRATFAVAGALAEDWEDMALSKGQLYMGDIGDNSANRASVVVYRVAEPVVPRKSVAAVRTTVASVALRLRYPDGSHNAETLIVHPTTGDLYIVTKAEDGHSGVYVLRGAATAEAGSYALEKVADLTISGEGLIYPNEITAGDISPTGDRIALRTYQFLYVYRPSSGGSFDSAWTNAATQVNAPFLLQAEALCFTPDGRHVLTTQEGLPAPLVEIDMRKV